MSTNPRTAKGLLLLTITLGCIFYIAWAMDHRYEPLPPLPTHVLSFQPGTPPPTALGQSSDIWAWARYLFFAPPLRPLWGMVWAMLFAGAAINAFFGSRGRRA